MITQRKVVALVDWNWMGHHPMYFTRFATALAEAGAEVLPWCPEPDDFRRRSGEAGLAEGVEAKVAEPEWIGSPEPSRFRPTRWRGHYEALRFFGGLGRRLRRWEREHGRKIDLVFFACVYDRQFEFFRFAERTFGFPWAGLYLHARSFRMPGSPIPYTGGLPCPEKIFTAATLRAAAVLDEGAIEPMRKLTGGRPVVVFPDPTSDSLPPPHSVGWGIVRKVAELAKGRPVVSLAGHLQWTKGIEDFTRLLVREDMKDVFFFLGGEVNWTEVPAERRRWMEHVWEEAENVHFHGQRLATLNTLIAKSDVVFAAYRSFPNSSNVLTKAAVFERPVVVSDGYLMAERVRRYHLGEVVPEGDGDALAAAVRRMVEPGYRTSLQQRAKWDNYRADHGEGRLRDAVAECLAACGTGGGRSTP